MRHLTGASTQAGAPRMAIHSPSGRADSCTSRGVTTGRSPWRGFRETRIAARRSRSVADEGLRRRLYHPSGHRPELPALGLPAESNSGRGHRASSGRGRSATGTVTLDSATRSRIVAGCCGGFRDDSPVAESIKAADVARDDVADGADAPRVGGGVVVVGHGRAEGVVPLPLYFRAPEASLPNRGRMFRESGGAHGSPK